MEKTLASLNEQQKEAVLTTEGPVLVLSGAGTGKTRVLTTRIAYILAQGLAKPWEVLALTFTNKAANEMKSRIAGLGQACEWCGTFHSICLKILRRNAAAANLRPDFLIFGEDEQKAILKTVIASLGMDIKKYVPGEWVEKISFYKDTGAGFDKKMSDDFNKIYAAYNAELERLNGLDFGDIILKTIKMFETAPDVLEKYRAQWKYILVDEYQDTNVMQNKLLRLIAGRNICCVGDDDQSIYSWRGAEIKNILHFAREYKDAKIIRLEQNYRSTGYILNAANSLIKNNAGRLGKDLRTNLEDGEKVNVIFLPSDYDEARFIVKMIKENEQSDYNEFAVLIRSGSLSRILEEEFAKNVIPYRLIGAVKFYDRSEIRDVVAYIRLLCFPFDDMSFMRIISKPRRGIGETTIEALRKVARQNNASMFDMLKKFPLKAKQAAAAAEFLGAFDFNWQGMPPAEAADAILSRAGYTKMWEESNDPDKDDRRKNIRELIRDVVAKFDDLAEFMEHVSLMTADDSRDDGGDAVSIMTIHAAKGLEFQTVFLPAWEDGIFPNEMAISDNGLEEERRLAYVAITRAKRNCFIFHTASRMQYGQFQHNQPSRFIEEMDNEFLRFPGRPAPAQATYKPVKKKIITNVGKLIDTDWGKGVIIEEQPEHYIVAVKNGIKKIPI